MQLNRWVVVANHRSHPHSRCSASSGKVRCQGICSPSRRQHDASGIQQRRRSNQETPSYRTSFKLPSPPRHEENFASHRAARSGPKGAQPAAQSTVRSTHTVQHAAAKRHSHTSQTRRLQGGLTRCHIISAAGRKLLTGLTSVREIASARR